jgi:hypothetical protein
MLDGEGGKVRVGNEIAARHGRPAQQCPEGLVVALGGKWNP